MSLDSKSNGGKRLLGPWGTPTGQHDYRIGARYKVQNVIINGVHVNTFGEELIFGETYNCMCFWFFESERILGVYIDSHLTWNEHIDTLRRKLLQRIAILAKARKYIPTKYRLLLYNASIKPLFTYCCTVWSNCSQTNLDELFKLQKRCARLILDSPRDARSYDNFQKLKWLPVDQLFKLNKLGLWKKVIDCRAPGYLITTLDSLRFEHKYSTKTKTLYRLPKPRNEAMRRTFSYSTTKELNAINLEPTTSFSLMKTTLTNNVASNYTVDNFKVKKIFWF